MGAFQVRLFGLRLKQIEQEEGEVFGVWTEALFKRFAKFLLRFGRREVGRQLMKQRQAPLADDTLCRLS